MKLFAFILLVLLVFLNLFRGSADIPVEEVLKVLSGGNDNEIFRVIVLENRLPQTVTAIISGSALAVSGLIMQTVFFNPLAGPSVLGISSASSLGAAVVTFLFSSIFLDFNSTFSIVLGSLLGAAAVLTLLVFLSGIIKNNLTLLIVGMLISYLSGAVITVLNFFGSEQSVKNFSVWNMGSFAGVTVEDLPVYFVVVILCSLAAFLTVKPLNLLLLGEGYAQNLGVNLKRVKTVLLLTSGVLAGVVTAYCGPVSFIGLAAPHISRLVLGTSNHAKVLPMSIILGSCMALVCNALCILPGGRGVLPLNAVTPVFGVPVIIYILLTKNRITL